MKIILINPPISRDDEFGNLKVAGNIIPPLGIGYIAALLEQNGHQVKIIDCAPSLMPQERLTELLSQEHPDIIGYTATTLLIANAMLSARMARKVCPGTLIVIGGAHVSALPEETLESGAFDVGVVGEGEYTMLELVNRLANKERDFSSVRGVAYRSNGKIAVNAARPFIEDLDSLPLPARHLFPALKEYSPSPVSYIKLPWAHMMTSRGCPYFCTFCDRKIFGERYRKMSANRVVDEIENLIKVHGAREIRFLDDVFSLDKKRFYAVIAEMKRRGLAFPWTCQARADNVDKELLAAMKKAGCWQILYGLESGDQNRLNLLKKGITLEQSRKAVKWAKEAGLQVRADFIVGTPGETKESFQKTIDFAKSLGLDVAHFNLFAPLPGTEIAIAVRKEGKILHYDYDMYRIHSCRETKLSYLPQGWTQQELKKWVVRAHKEFYLRFKYLFRQIMQIRSFLDIQRYYRGITAILLMK